MAENSIQSFIWLWGLVFIRRRRTGERESGRERKRKKKDGKVVFYISFRKCVLLGSKILLATRSLKVQSFIIRQQGHTFIEQWLIYVCLDPISLSLSCVSTEIHETRERGTWCHKLMVRTLKVMEDFLGPFSKGCFGTLNQTQHRLALLRWRTHKLICLRVLTLGSKTRPEYAKTTPSHNWFASVPSNNLHLKSYMTLPMGGKLCQFGSLRQRRELNPECLFSGWMFEYLWPLHFPSAATGKKAATTVLWGCVSLCQTLQKPFFHICIAFGQEIKISWVWGSPGDSLKQNFKGLKNVKVNQGETNWSSQLSGLDIIECGV